jgi:hypothetical protein
MGGTDCLRLSVMSKSPQKDQKELMYIYKIARPDMAPQNFKTRSLIFEFDHIRKDVSHV